MALIDTISLETLISSISYDHRDCMYRFNRIYLPYADLTLERIIPFTSKFTLLRL